MKVLGGPAAQEIGQAGGNVVGGLIGDRVHHWRQRNLIDVLEKTANKISDKGVSLDKARSLPDGELYAIFEGASKSEEPDVQAMWAGLLSSSLVDDQELFEVRRIVATLEQLSAVEARLLAFLYGMRTWESQFREIQPWPKTMSLREQPKEPTKKQLAQVEEHWDKLELLHTTALGGHAVDDLRPIGHLQRLGCIARDISIGDAEHVLERLEFDSMDGSTYSSSGSSTVKAPEFTKLVEDITAQIALLSGRLEDYADAKFVDRGNSYKPVNYQLTDFGHSLMLYCS